MNSLAVTTRLPLNRLLRGIRRGLDYRRRFGWRATLRRLQLEWRRRRQAVLAPAAPLAAPVHAATAAQWSAARFESLTPLNFYRLPRQGRRRVSLVTDSIGKGSLFGGVGTALILGSLLANRLQADLRLITRTEPPLPASLAHVLGLYGLALEGESQFRFAPPAQDAAPLDLLDDELVLTTSWWTTAATLPGVGLQRLVYLLQEDERMFYPFGDERLRCERLLRTPGLQLVLNTSLLKQHFVADGFSHYQHEALSFEPAFPPQVFRPRAKPAGAKPRFVFYARPHNLRNLFYLGIEVIEAAIERGVLDPDRWDIVFMGKDIPRMRLAGRVEPHCLENLDWARYAELVGGADLGLSLMNTPHPSYPPLDLVASGAVVVSNRHGVKRDLSHWSANLILCEAERDALVEGLAQGVGLALDPRRRGAQHAQSRLAQDWGQTLAPVLERLVDVAGAR